MNLSTLQLKTVSLILFSFLFGQLGKVSLASNPQPEKVFEVSLYTGIPGVGQLGETYKSITDSTKIPFTPIDITEDSELLKAGIVYGILFDSIGARVYFKRSGSCLISLSPPFTGAIKATQIQLFSMKKPSQLNWEEVLFKELGQPNGQGAGGLFGGDIYYYPWGDIEVSKIGLRHLSLYRDRSITEYRKTNPSMPKIKLFK